MLLEHLEYSTAYGPAFYLKHDFTFVFVFVFQSSAVMFFSHIKQRATLQQRLVCLKPCNALTSNLTIKLDNHAVHSGVGKKDKD